MGIKQINFRGSHTRAGGVVKNLAFALLTSTIMSLPVFAQDYSSLASKLVAGENVSITVKAQKVRENIYQQLQKLQTEVDLLQSGSLVVVKHARTSEEGLNYVFEIQKIKGAAKRMPASGKPEEKVKNAEDGGEAKNSSDKNTLKSGKRIKRVPPEEGQFPQKGPSWQKRDVDTTEAIKGLPVEEKTDGGKKEINAQEPLIEKDISFAVEQILDTAKRENAPVKKKNGNRKSKVKNGNAKANLIAYADKLSEDGRFEDALGIYEKSLGNARHESEVQLKIAKNLILRAKEIVGNNRFASEDEEKKTNITAYVYYDDAIKILKKLEKSGGIENGGKKEILQLLNYAYRGRAVCGSYSPLRDNTDMKSDLDSSQNYIQGKWIPRNGFKH